MRRSGFASGAAVAALAVAAAVGGGVSGEAASCSFAPPNVLPEPSHTRGRSNTIRWERVPSSCWENEDSAGKKSTDRRFVVTITNAQTGAKDTVTVHGDGEVDATIDPDELPAGPNGAIDGQRFTYTVLRKESMCYSGSPVFGTCTDRGTRTGRASPEVASTQDDRPPTGGSLVLGRGAVFTGTLEVPAAVTATDPGTAASGPGFVAFAGAVEGCRAREGCYSFYANGLTVRLASGRDGPRIVEARVYDQARAPNDDPGLTTVGRPPGNVSGPFSASIVLDRTPPLVALGISTSRPAVGVAVSFDASRSVDAGSGVEPSSGEWTFGDGATGTGLVRTHAYARTGTYQVAFAVSDRIGNRTSAGPVQLTVVSAPVQAPPVTTSTTPTQAPPAQVDRTAPALSALATTRRAGRSTLSFRLSELATVTLRVRRLAPAPARVLATFSRRLAAGRRGLLLPRAVNRPGRYELLLVARDGARNTSRSRTIRLTTRR